MTPSYNQGRFLEETIRSVLLQGYPNLEYIIIDGGSTDESVEIIRKYEPWLAYWVSEKDRGQSHAINKGFEHATGEIFAWLNSDDRYLPGALTSVVERFRNESNIGAVVGIGHKVDSHGRILFTHPRPSLTLETFLDWSTGNFLQPACFFSRDAWENSGPLDEGLYYCMDVDLWRRMVEKFRFVKLDRVLAHALGHAAAKTTAERERMSVEILLNAMKYGGDDIARRGLLAMADELGQLRQKMRWLRPFARLSVRIRRGVRVLVASIPTGKKNAGTDRL